MVLVDAEAFRAPDFHPACVVAAITVQDTERVWRVVGVEQLNMDRLVAVDVDKAGSTRRLVFELVRGFNAVVEDGVILGCLHPRRMKDRALVPKEPYVLPPWRGLNPFTCSQAEFLEGLKRAGWPPRSIERCKLLIAGPLRLQRR